MKVIDKRRNNEQWDSGDVICCWNVGGEKNYEFIVQTTAGTFNIASLNKTDGGALVGCIYDKPFSSISELRAEVSRIWCYTKKVNAHLVVED